MLTDWLSGLIFVANPLEKNSCNCDFNIVLSGIYHIKPFLLGIEICTSSIRCKAFLEC